MKVLFICIHNSARSQMAEAFFNHYCGNEHRAESAGLEKGTLNPLAVEVMREIDIDIAKKGTQDVFDVFRSGRLFAYVITVCDQASAERCPIFPGITTRLNWSFSDPSAFQGTDTEKLQKTREVRDQMEEKIEEFCSEICAAPQREA